MGRKSGYDLPPGTRRPSQPPGTQPAAPASQGGPPATNAGDSSQGSQRGGNRQGPFASGFNHQQVPPVSSTGFNTSPLPMGFIPAHRPGERCAASAYDSAREYAAVETGRLERRRHVPEGSSGLQNEVLNLEGPVSLPPVRAVARIGGSRRQAAPSRSGQPAPVMAAPPSRIPSAASGVVNQESQATVWARVEFARRFPSSPFATREQVAQLEREYEVQLAAWQRSRVSRAHETGTFFFFSSPSPPFIAHSLPYWSVRMISPTYGGVSLVAPSLLAFVYPAPFPRSPTHHKHLSFSISNQDFTRSSLTPLSRPCFGPPNRQPDRSVRFP